MKRCATFAAPPRATIFSIKAALALAQLGELILEGATNEEIAKVRGTSINTVNKQVRALFTHFNVQCREALIGAWCQYAANPCA